MKEISETNQQKNKMDAAKKQCQESVLKANVMTGYGCSCPKMNNLEIFNCACVQTLDLHK